MILVDTSVWADHFRAQDAGLATALQRQLVGIHRFVVGELALGHLRPRHIVLGHLKALPHLASADDERVLQLIEAETLAGTGIGYIDAHLLTAVASAPGWKLWTRDRRLHAAASRLNLAFESGG